MANAERGQQYEHVCCGCGEAMASKHLRVNFAPPDQKWEMVRAHDLTCLLDFLEDEETGEATRRVFTKSEWIDSLAPAPAQRP